MSGGVDSSVSAALLKKAGCNVTGVFIKVWQPDWIECNWKEERLEAMRAAAHLDISFITLDLEKEYKNGVIDYMIAEYTAGRTPNPDVMCNREVKFGAFWKWAKSHGADYIATGHYARIDGAHGGLRFSERGKSSAELFPNPRRFSDAAASPTGCENRLRTFLEPNSSVGANALRLLMGVDSNKDQSYFLWTLKQEDLEHILFPVGHLTKPEVRKLAKKLKLPNAEKKDSQGLCFIGKVDVKEFLKYYIQTESGRVIDENGETIGTHPGAFLFTIGERHGFTVDQKHKTPSDAPYFVIDKDVDQNTITVSNKDLDDSLPQAKTLVRISDVNWIRGETPDIELTMITPDLNQRGFSFQARSRYRQELQSVKISGASISEVAIEFEKPQDTLTPGQSLVIYDGEECLGGGVIQ